MTVLNKALKNKKKKEKRKKNTKTKDAVLNSVS